MVQHPLAYLAHRASHFNEALDFLIPVSRSVSRSTEQVNPFGWTYSVNLVSRFLIQAANALGSTPLSWPFVWLVSGVVTFANAHLLRDNVARQLVTTLSLSGVLYTLGFFVVGVAYGHRYHAWLFLSAGVALAVSIGGAFRQGTLRSLLQRQALCLLLPVALALIWRIWSLPAPYLLAGAS